ncbi:SDR family NAD(P)-dependent oxidoreductase [Clostridium sp. DL1XJH146]
MNNNFALITGGNKGIGLELANLFAKDGYNLILVARDYETLKSASIFFEKMYKIKTIIIKKDLSQRNSPKEIYEQLKSQNIEVTVLVNNAGFGTYGPFIETNLEKELDMINLNISCTTHMTKLFARDMAKNGYGRILNIASTASFQSGPYMAVYFATKSYILSFSESISKEFEKYGLTVTALCPGPTDSNFTSTAKGSSSSRIFQHLLTPKEVAKQGYSALMHNKRVKIVGNKNFLLSQLVRFLPRNGVLSISKHMMSKTK